jgi:hypothetical protein
MPDLPDCTDRVAPLSRAAPPSRPIGPTLLIDRIIADLDRVVARAIEENDRIGYFAALEALSRGR